VSTLFELTPVQAAALGTSQRTQDWHRTAVPRVAIERLHGAVLCGCTVIVEPALLD